MKLLILISLFVRYYCKILEIKVKRISVRVCLVQLKANRNVKETYNNNNNNNNIINNFIIIVVIVCQIIAVV